WRAGIINFHVRIERGVQRPSPGYMRHLRVAWIKSELLNIAKILRDSVKRCCTLTEAAQNGTCQGESREHARSCSGPWGRKWLPDRPNLWRECGCLRLARFDCFRNSLVASRINLVYRIIVRVEVLVETKWIFKATLTRIHRPETARSLVIVPVSQVVETNAVVQPLATISETVRCRAARPDGHSKRIEVIAIDEGSRRIHEKPDIPVAVVAGEGGSTRAAD